MSNSELLACPGCGGTWVALNRPANGAAPFVLCKQCGWAGPQIAAAVSDDNIAIAAWNDRTQLDELRAVLVEAREVIRADRNSLFDCCTVGPEHDPATLEDGAATAVADYDKTLAKIDKALGATSHE